MRRSRAIPGLAVALLMATAYASATCVTETSAVSRTPKGRVSSTFGKVVPRAYVEVFRSDDDEPFRRTRSDRNGNYVLADLPSGKYRVRVTDSKFQHIVFWYKLELGSGNKSGVFQVFLSPNSECHDMTIHETKVELPTSTKTKE